MARKKKGELPSGSIRRKVFIGYEYLVDEKGNPILDEKGKQKKRAKYKSVTASSAKEAEQLKAEVKASKIKYSKNSEMTLRVAIDKYINSSEAILSPSTIKGYETIKRNAFQTIMDVRMCDLNDVIIRDAINLECQRPKNKCPDKVISSKTVVNEYGLISAVINHYCPNLDIEVTLPQVSINQNDISTATVLFNVFKGTEMELPVLLAMWLSFTVSEILGLTKSKSISADGNSISIKEVRVIDKNGCYVVKNKGKQPTRERTLSIPPYIKSLIDKVETDRLVTMSGAAINGRFDRAIKKAGLPHMTFHDLRHVNASVMSETGVPVKQAEARGGWKSDNIMKTRYVQAFSEERALADKKVDDYFNNIVYSDDDIDEKKYRAWLILFDKRDCEESKKEFKEFISR